MSSPERPESLLDPRDASPGARQRLRAWLALQRRLALRPQDARVALEAAPDPGAALHRATGEVPASVVPDRELDALARRLAHAGVRLVPFGSPLYPERLAALSDPAPLLAVRGDARRLSALFVALVGARAASAYGLGVARRLARDLAAHGVGIVSGLALGVDAEAHRGALEAGGCTVAVLGCGPDRVYPAQHHALAAEIAAGGALVSELPPGAPPLPHHFPLRNRLISGLSAAVVVVEARAHSGSLITAEHAAEQGRDVLAVPGPVDSPTSEGPNRLLRDGVSPALDAGDVLRALGRGGVPARAPDPPMAAEARALWDSLRHASATRDELAARLGLALPDLARRLLALELEGRLVEDRDGRLRVR